MKIKFDYNSIDLITSERFAVLEAYFFDTYFYARRFEDLVEYLDYYVFDNFYEEREEFIIKSDIISVGFDDYLAFTRNLIDIIELSFETMHVMLQQSSTGNSAICFVGDELGVKMSVLCFYNLCSLFFKERERYMSSLPINTKTKSKITKGRDYIEECVDEFKTFFDLYPIPEDLKKRLKRYTKKNFQHYDDYLEAARVLARYSLNVMTTMETVKAEDIAEELLKSLQPANLDQCTETVERGQNEYLVIRLTRSQY